MSSLHKTTINDSLANGLTTRFFKEMEDGADRVISLFLEKQRNLKKRNKKNFTRITNNVRSTFAHYSLAIYEGGSAGRPYLAFDLLTVTKDRELNSWNERCLTGNTLLIVFDPDFIDVFPAIYNIGEHAISRLFLRSKVEFKNNTIDYKHITEELVFIPLWANFFATILMLSEELPFYGNCYPVIPAPHGLFLCEFKYPCLIEIRTFISDQQLTHEQMIAKNLLIRAGEALNESAICFSCALCCSEIDRPDILEPIISKRLFNSDEFSTLKNVIFHRIEDDRERAVFKSKFNQILKNRASHPCADLDPVLIEIGARELHSRIKHLMLTKTGI